MPENMDELNSCDEVIIPRKRKGRKMSCRSRSLIIYIPLCFLFISISLVAPRFSPVNKIEYFHNCSGVISKERFE